MHGSTALRTLATVALSLTLASCDSGGGSDDAQDLSEVFDCDVAEITTGQTVSGSLRPSDCVLDDGSFIDYYAFRLTEAADVVIEQQSDDVDAYLHLYDAAGDDLDEDDDGGTAQNARLDARLQPGLYVVGANSYDSREAGDYTLRVATGG